MFSLKAATAAQDSENRQTFEIDSKAMRKFDSDMVMYLAWEATEVGTATMSVTAGSRILLKLA